MITVLVIALLTQSEILKDSYQVDGIGLTTPESVLYEQWKSDDSEPSRENGIESILLIDKHSETRAVVVSFKNGKISTIQGHELKTGAGTVSAGTTRNQVHCILGTPASTSSDGPSPAAEYYGKQNFLGQRIVCVMIEYEKDQVFSISLQRIR